MLSIMSTFIIAAITTLISLSIVKRYWLHKFFFKDSNIPLLPTTSLLGGRMSTFITSRKSYPEVVDSYFRQMNSNTFCSFIGPIPCVFTKDLDLIQKKWIEEGHREINRPELGVTNELIDSSIMMARDDNWRRTRRVIGAHMT